MKLSEEGYRARWFILFGVWLLVAGALFFQAETIRRYLETVGQLGLRGETVARTPLKQIYPSFAADAQTWVRHALAMIEGNGLQLRFTHIDNAPDGREVYWNSAWAWIIAGAGWIYHLFTGAPLATAVEKATLWLNPIVLLTLIVGLSAWATRRAGAIAGVLTAVALLCHDRINEGFFPSYVDHHGLLTVAVFGTMLGAIFMGGGWWKEKQSGLSSTLPDSPERARSAAVFSATCGALGMWVSAASILPPIALVGAAGLLAAIIHGQAASNSGARFDPQVWRIWGRVGAGASVAFYLLEYFPKHLGMRLEANHPLLALGWLGGGELVAELSARWLAPRGQRSGRWLSVLWPILGVGATPLALAIGGSSVFIVLDPFLARLHSNYIQEFLPIWRVLQGANTSMIVQVLVVDNLPLVAGFATITYLRRDAPIILWFAAIAGLLFNVMAWWQSRWLLNASGVQICLTFVVFDCWTAGRRPAVRWVGAIALVGALYFPGLVQRMSSTAGDVKMRRVSPRDALNALYRDIAGAIRASQPAGNITLLASPNGSTSIGYYGRFSTLGTLYWENRDGLKSAAAIFSAKPDQEAIQLLRTHGVTHIAIVSDENFIQQYFELLHPGTPIEGVKQGLGYKLFVERNVPQWLEVIPYKVPDDLASLKVSVMLLKVNYNQSLPEALYHLALAQMIDGALDAADHTFDVLLSKAPNLYEAWLRKGDILLARHRWNDAAEIFAKAIALAPSAERPNLSTFAAKAFYEQHQHAIAVRFYRTSMREQPTPNIACYLAWILATSVDDSLRNGAEALRLALEAVKADPNSSTYLESLAAALAETGRFDEAALAADRALVNARLAGEPDAIQRIFDKRLAVIKSGKPLRN